MKVLEISLFAAAVMGLLFVWAIAPHSSIAQTADYDSDDDGLIEIRTLEQLNVVRWDLDGDGDAESESNRDAYEAAFPDAVPGMGCAESECVGYELARDLDFDDAGSYASGVVNAKWTDGAGWLPIGLQGIAFYATFEGNEHIIANLYIKRSGRTDPGVVGLFGESRGSITQIGLIDVDISGDGRVGGLVGGNYGGEIVSSYTTGNVSGNNHYAGGLVGYNDGQISTSYSTGNVSGDGFIGGLVGCNCYLYGQISVSYATGDVSGSSVTGGLVGENDGQISASYATGDVSGDNGYVGGLVGENRGGQISASYATGDVSGSSEVGGLVGFNVSTISASYATGNVSGSIQVGGLVGSNHGQISASYATSKVSGGTEVGGLAGYNGGQILACYSTGSVSGQSLVGGLIGRNYDSATLLAGYCDTQTSGQSLGVGDGLSDGVEGKTTTELQAPTGYTGIYAGWLLDFDNADGDFDDKTGVDDSWDFGTASEYPALKADYDGDGIAMWEEFGDQRGQGLVPRQTPLPVTPSPTPTPVPPGPTPVVGADLELTMLLSNYLGYLWYYVIVENNGPSGATGVVLTDRFPEGISPVLRMPVQGTCSGGRTVVCELGSLEVGSKMLVMILARPDRALSQNVPVNTASVSAAEPDPYPANNKRSR